MANPTFTFSPRYLSGTSAWAAHLPFGYDLVKALRPRLLVELGTWRGDSFFTFCQAVAESKLPTVCYAVDHWRGDGQAGEQTGDAQYLEVAAHAAAHYKEFAYLMRTDFGSAAREFTDGSADLVHVDGFHSLEAVTQDFETWLPKLRDGGVMLFHDIMVRSSEAHPDFGVWSFWDGLKARHKTWQFVHGFGLGIIIKGENPEMAAWLDAATGAEWGEYYAKRGTEVTNLAAGRVAQAELGRVKKEMNALVSDNNRLQRRVEKLEAQMAAARDVARRWNGKSFIRRAFSKLDLKAAASE